MRNNKTCDIWYTYPHTLEGTQYLPSFKLMVVAAVYEKVFDHWTHKALNIIFPTISVNKNLRMTISTAVWLNEVLRSLDRGFLFYGYIYRPLKVWFWTMAFMFWRTYVNRYVYVRIFLHAFNNVLYSNTLLSSYH